VIDIGNHLETKIAAFKAHTSQAPLWALFEENVRKRGEREMFHLSASVKPGPVRHETDLFEGVEA
jgi:LmbE family N-acetylglucosaminyl deacetylase